MDIQTTPATRARRELLRGIGSIPAEGLSPLAGTHPEADHEDKTDLSELLGLPGIPRWNTHQSDEAGPCHARQVGHPRSAVVRTS
jgi:hypothetical protein